MSGKPFDSFQIARAAEGMRVSVRYTLTDEWFGPGQAITPMAPPDVKGRAWDYMPGLNMQIAPRRDSMSGVSFDTLRALADGYDLLRLVIETRKDQIEKLSWMVRPRIAKGKTASAAHTKRAEQAEKLLRSPDRVHSFPKWLRMAVEEILVTDALTIYPRPTMGGGVYSLDLIDGATIKPLIDQTGRPPEPPEAAYQQVLKGIPVADFTRDELLYLKANPRVNRLYGFSPVEQIITTVNIALRRQSTQMSYFTEGNVPEALIGVPSTWTVPQTKEFQNYWDTVLAGNTALRRRAKFVPGEIAKSYVPTREPVIKDVFDEWLARVICFAFSIPPTAFVAQVNRSVAETAMKQAMEEGILPLMQSLEWVMDRCLEIMGFADCDFAWDQESDEDPEKTARTRSIYIKDKVLTVNEVREDMGRDPVPWGDEPPAPPPQLAPGADPDSEGGKGKPREGQTPPAKPGAEGKDDDEEGEPAGVDKSERPAWLKALKARRIVLKVERQDVKRASTLLSRRAHGVLKRKAKAFAAELADFIGAITKAEDDDDNRRQADSFVDGHDFGHWDDLADAVEARALQVFEATAREALIRIGVQAESKAMTSAVKVIHEDAVRYARKAAGELVKDVSERTRKLVRSTTTEAIREGWSSTRLAEEIARSPAFNEARARTIARTELAIANSEGYRNGLEASGVPIQTKQWLLGGNPCDDCQGNADQGAIAYSENFQSGHAWTPAHPNCVCDVAVTVKE